ncbi:hypothetical protein NPX13_g4724 [Xylaria arbuscula]|uniref:Heterokaryon incompatibility domain-containing protein n=1 Tax=Xylaria arbuscula TaxID=114810 RepID=A0A9W8TNC2_9PEZI|nr:hypothetical protein NPX13_g4724 [Xylaria arbuscula]
MVIHEYQGEGIPPYAILSHTWGREEVSFSDFQEGKGQGLAGYKKIRGCCEQAKSDGLDAVWIDTCCIDKRSSAELSEAINSMFKWYQNAAICYAYLDDVITEDEGAPAPSLPASFPTSRWFRRGWTLQELLAPSVVIFYSVNWVNIGNRNGLASIIAETTKIDPRFFDSGKFEDFSIAQRMSWASRRQTTRIEDEAYCLLGLFGVNMPLLYGEGEQAFVRLQQEIMKESDDQTIFAWSISDFIADSGLEQDFQGGVLAPSPKSPYVATNKGLQISLPLISAEEGTSILIPSRKMRDQDAWIPRLTLTTASGGYIAVLNCQPTRDSRKRIGFYVEQNAESKSYVRVNYRNGMAMVSIEEAQEKATHTDMLIQLQNRVSRNFAIEIERADRPVLIRSFKNLLSEFELGGTTPKSVWQHQPTGALLSTVLDFSSATDKKPCALEFINAHGQGFVLLVQKSISLASVTGLEACLVDRETVAKGGVDAAAHVRDAIGIFRSHGPSITQASSHGLLNIVVTITEARHASIVNLEAQRVTSSFRPKEGPSKLVVPPVAFSTFPDITFSSAEAV